MLIAFLISILTFGNVTAISVQASTLKKAPTNKAGRVVTPGFNTLLNGIGAPKLTTGVNGDFFLDTKNMMMYGPKTLGKWPAGVSLRGTAGTNGITGAAGAKGISSSASEGQTGPAGPAGPAGAAGPAGSPGATGAPGSTGPAGAGSPGTPGSPGGTGSKGDSGTPGSPGTPGAKGDTGTAGSSNVTVINLNAAGGGVNWGLSSATPTETLSGPFGNLQTNTKYRFTIIVNGSANRLGFAALPVGSVITLAGAGATLSYSTHYGIGTVSDADYVQTFNFSFLHEGTVTVMGEVASLTVSVIDGDGWSAGMNANAFKITAKAYIQVA